METTTIEVFVPKQIGKKRSTNWEGGRVEIGFGLDPSITEGADREAFIAGIEFAVNRLIKSPTAPSVDAAVRTRKTGDYAKSFADEIARRLEARKRKRAAKLGKNYCRDKREFFDKLISQVKALGLTDLPNWSTWLENESIADGKVWSEVKDQAEANGLL